MTTNLPAKTIDDAISKILPEYGSKGLDVPTFDRDKHMYLVDQYQYASGNRTLTYAAISDCVIVEVVLGHYHGWEYMNKLRILTPDGTRIKVAATKEWEQSTRADLHQIREAVADGLTDYISSNPVAKGISKEEILKSAKKITDGLFSQTEDYLDTPLGRKVLLAYCENCNYCKDLIKFV
jgi:hypothetical protein